MQTPVTSITTPDMELDAYSIEEFCRRHSISRGTFYNLQADGDAPQVRRVKSRVLISKESATEWRSRQ
jgi:predicted DNA-binding transcriptional regulator AlpA